MIAVGKHDNRLVIIPYEEDGDTMVPVAIHATTRQQIKFRLKSGRFTKRTNPILWFILKKEDILHLPISEESESGSVELSPNITAELNNKGELIGIGIINASVYIRDSIFKSVQGKLLNLSDKKAVAE